MAVIVENKLHFLGKNLGSLRFIKNVGIQHEINIWTEWSMPTDDWEWMKRPTAPAVENTPFEMSLTVQEAPHVPLLTHSDVASYVESIMNPELTARPRFSCPAINVRRYQHLQPHPMFFERTKVHYMFAMNLRDEGVELLPRLLASVIEAMRFLGPHYCALSLVGGGGTPDGVYDVLEALRPHVEGMGARYYLRHPAIYSEAGGQDRIMQLARLRNLALAPLTNPSRQDSGRYTNETTVIFTNDVAICTEDILELVHQRKVQEADMTCAMDWILEGLFYDVWVSRTLAGNIFFRVPLNGSWEFSAQLMPNSTDAPSRERFDARRPFQVFACWNGAVAFNAAPLFRTGIRPGVSWSSDVADPRQKVDPVRFRRNMELDGECYMGEPTLFAKDLWYRGFGKIAVVPSVALSYTMADGEKMKRLKGWVSDFVGDKGPELDENPIPERITWQLSPPKEVLCARTWQTQRWVPWDQSLRPSSGMETQLKL
ncbi:hypothetical protein MCOR14_001339 [Pyricularia oryzae]|nr:hypothetical protein MCOR34_001047 [Pyricularia oryzae]KAI6470251.1 hypothetical protein MCOR17_003561 [Pyricularia oryzae]KAI6511580.1 hypothetical protein MCOR13_000546 [Pyricularia oryzae]KAI6602417.1 hypothetical protein MCOR04_001994 [Pyricularia oryzae]KAI6644224.1 hypothetical protein MCOR14_001339 [Pyricularia oryzae]